MTVQEKRDSSTTFLLRLRCSQTTDFQRLRVDAPRGCSCSALHSSQTADNASLLSITFSNSSNRQTAYHFSSRLETCSFTESKAREEERKEVRPYSSEEGAEPEEEELKFSDSLYRVSEKRCEESEEERGTASSGQEGWQEFCQQEHFDVQLSREGRQWGSQGEAQHRSCASLRKKKKSDARLWLSRFASSLSSYRLKTLKRRC